MRKTATGAALALLFLGSVLVPAGLASAVPGDNDFTNDNPRLNMFAFCDFVFTPGEDFILTGTGELEFDANSPFWIRHGWFEAGWSDLPPEQRRALMSPATEFVLLVDGMVFRSRMSSPHVETFFGFEDAKLKEFTSEFRNGLSGTHVVTGMWFLDASSQPFEGEFGVQLGILRCDLTVHFT